MAPLVIWSCRCDRLARHRQADEKERGHDEADDRQHRGEGRQRPPPAQPGDIAPLEREKDGREHRRPEHGHEEAGDEPRNASVVRATRRKNETLWIALPRAVNLGRGGCTDPLMDQSYTVLHRQPGTLAQTRPAVDHLNRTGVRPELQDAEGAGSSQLPHLRLRSWCPTHDRPGRGPRSPGDPTAGGGGTCRAPTTRHQRPGRLSDDNGVKGGPDMRCAITVPERAAPAPRGGFGHGATTGPGWCPREARAAYATHGSSRALLA